MSVGSSQLMQVYNLLVRINDLLKGNSVEAEKAVAATPAIERSELSLQKQVRTLNMLTMEFRVLTGDETIDGATQKIQGFIQVLMRIRMLLYAVQAASGPWGFLYAGANAVAVGISLGNLGQ